MKRIIASVLVLALIIAFALPGVAAADKGGVPNGNSAKAGKTAPEDAEGEDGVEPSKPGKSGEPHGKPEDGVPPGQAKDKVNGAEGEDVEEPLDLEDPADGEDEEDAGKQRGIENALSRLERNLARIQERVDAGLRKRLPQGLVNTINKFMMWLGLVPDDTDLEQPEVGTEEPPPVDEAPGEELPPIEESPAP